MQSLLPILDKFNHVSQSNLEKVELLDRIDFKYVFELQKLPEVLSKLPIAYDLLLTGNKGIGKYESHYFDTENFQMYLNHHNGLVNRHKIRFRKYLDTGTTYFEIKQKTNKERTIKSRVEVDEGEYSINSEARELLSNITGLDSKEISEVLIVRYNRVSLISTSCPERVTIDIGLQYVQSDKSGKLITFPGIAIAEIKQQRTGKSFFRKVMQDHHIQPLRISKYCLGMAAIMPDLKRNNFKSKLLYVTRLSKSGS